MYIPRETIELVRDRAVIQDIIRKYVPSLKKKGKNYLGLCPFHKEKTPSFTVSPDKNMYHCFGCHESGNVFTFISKVERLTFPESVKFIAQLIGIELPDNLDRNYQDNSELYRINQYAAALYHKALFSNIGKHGMDYIVKRGVDKNIISEFKLGFAPESWDFLTSSLKKKRINLTKSEQIGLISKSKNNTDHYYDRFRNRVIFPIYSMDNKVVAFGGRIIGEGTPKYLNSPESEIFKKRNVLYGLHLAKKSIQQLNRAIVVEGYLDVVGCYQYGIHNVVAPLGTALSDSHIRLLARFCNEVILLFDSDSAGIKAALRSLEISSDISIDVRVAILPEGDPFDFVQKKGMRELMTIIDTALPPIDFQIEQVLKTRTDKNHIKILNMLFEIIKGIKYESQRMLYLKKISSLLKIDEKAIIKDFDNFDKKGDLTVLKQAKKDKKENELPLPSRGYRDLVILLLQYPGLIEKAAIDFAHMEIEDTLASSILNTIFSLFQKGEYVTLDKMFDFFHDGIELEFLKEISGIKNTHKDPDSVYRDIYINIKLYDINNKIDYYANLIKNDATGLVKNYITEIEVLRREKEKLSIYMYNK